MKQNNAQSLPNCARIYSFSQTDLGLILTSSATDIQNETRFTLGEKIIRAGKKFFVPRKNFMLGEIISKLREEISWNENSILNPNRKSPETKIRFQIRGENLLEQKFDFKPE
jgi:hypothetical protein